MVVGEVEKSESWAPSAGESENMSPKHWNIGKKRGEDYDGL